jgi:hypothetical protein
MSDRKNRDVGRKREQQKHKYDCDCWLCAPENKKRLLYAADMMDDKGYKESTFEKYEEFNAKRNYPLK